MMTGGETTGPFTEDLVRIAPADEASGDELRAQTAYGKPDAATSRLVAYVDDEPAG